MKPSSELRVPIAAGAGRPPGTVPALVYQAESARAALVLAHGAGAPQRSEFMTTFASRIAGAGVDVLTFDFPYMAAGRRIPDRGATLEAAYRSVVAAVRGEIASARGFLFIGGKSMGGRIATQVAAADPGLPAAGLVLLGYPLHPPGLHTKLRASHLPAVKRPMLFVQGSRDAFGTPEELDPILAALSPRPTLHVVQGGDHSLEVSRRDRGPETDVYEEVTKAIVGWINSVIDR